LEKIKDEFKTFQHQFSLAAEENNLEQIGFLKHRLSSSLKILGLEELDENIENVRILISKNASSEDIVPNASKIKKVSLQIIKSIERELERSSQEALND